MTIDKPLYEIPNGDEHPGYLDPKEWLDILKNIPVSEMVKKKVKERYCRKLSRILLLSGAF